MKTWLFMGTAIANFLIVTSALSSSNPKNVAHAPHLQVKIASSITKGERRREERHSKSRSLCEGCYRPPTICVCEALPPTKLDTKTTVLVLQHPNEFRKKTFSTVPLMSLVLENMQVKRDYKFGLEDLPLVQEYLDRGQKPLLLYPSDDAVSLDGDVFRHEGEALEDENSALLTINRMTEEANLMIVLDGTWAEAKRMAVASPFLFGVCEQVQFEAPASCLYDAVRKEPFGHCLSTLEACAQALILLEGANEVADQLKKVLALMVDIQLFMEKQRHDDPRQKGKQVYERNRRRRQVEKTLFEKSNPKLFDDGEAILRSLTIEDASYINKNWYHRSGTSLRTIEQCLDNGLACFGIEKDGLLCAYIVRAADGTLGTLYVDETCRRKGYGKALVREASRVLRELDKPLVCFIRISDDEAETFFRSVGWVVDEVTEIKTKHRMERRKWIPASSKE